MKKLLLSSAALILMSAPVLAADMPAKARPQPMAAPFTWSGCYIGVNLGYVWANFEKSDVREFDASGTTFIYNDFDFDGDGVTGGLQIGCNWQTGITVWGVETDFNLTSIEARTYFDNAIFNTPSSAFDTDVHSRLRWFGTVRGLVGWTVTPETLLYVTGGFAYGHVNSVLHFPTAAGATTGFINFDSQHHYGYTVGVGAEAKIARNFSAKIEYLYVDLHSQTYDFPIAGDLYRWDQRVDFHVVRVGLNYQFDWGYPAGAWGVGKGKGKAPAPVVAKY
jgi:outer membrane immunogenic protein